MGFPPCSLDLFILTAALPLGWVQGTSGPRMQQMRALRSARTAKPQSTATHPAPREGQSWDSPHLVLCQTCPRSS